MGKWILKAVAVALLSTTAAWANADYQTETLPYLKELRELAAVGLALDRQYDPMDMGQLRECVHQARPYRERAAELIPAARGLRGMKERGHLIPAANSAMACLACSGKTFECLAVEQQLIQLEEHWARPPVTDDEALTPWPGVE